eukprot:g13198.t1
MDFVYSIILITIFISTINGYTDIINTITEYNIEVQNGKISNALKPCRYNDIFTSITDNTIKQEAIHFCQYIDLDRSNIKYEELIALLDTLPTFEQSNLTIKLDRNNIKTRGAKKIAEFLQYNNTKIRSLYLYGNFIFSEGGKAIANALNNVSSNNNNVRANYKQCFLEELYIGGNHIENEGAISFAILLNNNNSRIKKLHMNGNNIQPDGLISIARSLKRNSILDELDIQWNYMNNASAYEFEIMLETNTQLKVLLLSGINKYRNIELCTFHENTERKKC